MSNLLTVDRLEVAYGSGVRAVRDVTLNVAAGELAAVLGANGAGKTTLLRALSGLLPSHGGRVISGQISAMGHDLLKLPGHQRLRIGMTQTFEGRRILRQFTVVENLLAGGIATPTNLVRGRIEELLHAFPILAERRHQPAGLLSGGEQQILAIARALVSDPQLLMLDEPSLGLAPIMIKRIGETIRTVRDLGKTVLLVEQNASLALALADRAYLMQNGSTVGEGRAADLKAQGVMSHFYLGLGEGSIPLRRRATADHAL